ncbi:hypothetical protein CR513_39360, partial [Mucuna pruriens]
MAGVQFHTLLRTTSRSSLVKSSIRPFFNNTIKVFSFLHNPILESGNQDLRIGLKPRKQTCQNYGNRSRLMEERAPSTAEEFQRVAEEKAREAKEGVASQNVSKSYDGAQEATIADSKVQSVKNT